MLFAIVNNYEFMYEHCGINGRIFDEGILKETEVILDIF